MNVRSFLLFILVLLMMKLIVRFGIEPQEMQGVYHALVTQVHAIFDAHIQQHTRGIAAPLAHHYHLLQRLRPPLDESKGRPKTRSRSNTNPPHSQSSASPSVSAAASLQSVVTVQLAYKDL